MSSESDFNDVAQLDPKAAAAQLKRIQSGQRVDTWPDPGKIAAEPEAKPYPIHVFPESARLAIQEYQAFGRQPLAMVASWALGTMALACQALADVARDEILIGPCSLNLLIIGRSGERKTGADTVFSKAVREWEFEQRQERLPAYRKAKALVQTNSERRASVQKKLGQLEVGRAADAESDIARLEARLEELEGQAANLRARPLPFLLYEVVSTEGLTQALAVGWPSAALMSDEAGLVLGGRGMSDDNALAFLTTLNRLWDGKPYRPVYKQAKADEIRGRRFSSCLMLQWDLLSKILDKGGRGVGFFGRYLMTAPESTMGTRFYHPPAKNTPALSIFNGRVRDLLNLDLPVNDQFQLSPPVMLADRAARNVFQEYHDAVEAELGTFGEFSQITDIGSKSAENATRIAGVFQLWDQGPGDTLRASYMQAGVAVAYWHLNEAARIFADADKPTEVHDAELLSHWLVEVAPQLKRSDGSPLLQCGRMPAWEIGRLGPGPLRNSKGKDRREKALQELAAVGVEHVRERKEGKRVEIEVNPKLLSSAKCA